MEKGIEITGKTVDEAIEKGLDKLKIEKGDAEIKILDEGKSGLFGLMGSAPARIKISVKTKTPSIEKGEKPTQQVNKLPENAVSILSKILELYNLDTFDILIGNVKTFPINQNYVLEATVVSFDKEGNF